MMEEQKKKTGTRYKKGGKSDMKRKKNIRETKDSSDSAVKDVNKTGKKKTPKWVMNVLLVFFIAVFAVCLGSILFGYVIPKIADLNSTKLALDLTGRDDIKLDDNSKNSLLDATIDRDNSPIKNVSVDELNLDDIKFIDMSLTKLININKDIVGWFDFMGPASIEGLPISSPLLQGSDNYEYLEKDYEKKSNPNGSIYADTDVDMSDVSSNKNIVMYGHARSYYKFGGLKYLNEAKRWSADAHNHFVILTTPKEQLVYQVFSWYETTATTNYIQSQFSSDKDFLKFLNTIQSKNQIPALKKFDFTPDSRIVTLSTCKTADKEKRVAVHAVLVKSRPLKG